MCVEWTHNKPTKSGFYWYGISKSEYPNLDKRFYDPVLIYIPHELDGVFKKAIDVVSGKEYELNGLADYWMEIKAPEPFQPLGQKEGES